VTLVRAGFNDSTTGIWRIGSQAGAPQVTIDGAAFLHNRMAAWLDGPMTRQLGEGVLGERVPGASRAAARR
jgi:hypothetical protein